MPSLYLNQIPPVPAWLSPALTVVKSAGLNQDKATPLLDVNPVAPSTEYQQIRAVAGNDTNSTFSDVHVQIWALAFATATASGLYLNSMGGTKGITVPSGGAMPIAIGPGQQQPFTRNWDETYGLTSTEPEIVSHFVGGEVHCCIFGNVYHPADPGSAAVANDPNGPASHLDVAGNRRHAQRNMTIKAHNAPGLIAFHMFAANPDADREQIVTLRIAERHAPRLQDWEVAELAALGPWIRRTAEAPNGGIAGIEFVIDGKPYPVRVAHEPLKDLEMDIRHVGAGREREFPLDADQALPMKINATIPDEQLVVRVIDVVQFQQDETVGGARLIVVTVPADLHKQER